MSACDGQVETEVLDAKGLSVGAALTGVIFYPPQFVKSTHSFTTRVDDTGKVIGTLDEGTCRAVVQKQEITILPDLGRPMLVRNASGWASAAKFSVSLSNGLLTAVNAEPTQKPSDLISAAAGLAKELGIKALLAPGAPPACNSGPRITAFERATLN
jgi:hypothetical protein